MSKLPAEILKARLDVVLRFETGAGLADAIRAWMAVEPDADEGAMGALLVEAIVQAVGDDAVIPMVIYASAFLRSELLEVRNGGL